MAAVRPASGGAGRARRNRPARCASSTRGPGSRQRTAASIAPHVGPAFARRDAAERLDGLVADPPRRHVDDPFEADAVGVGPQDPQVRERVLDLAAAVEPRPTDELVADAIAQERFLDRAGLGVHPVHHRDVARPELRFVVLVGAAGQRRRAPSDEALDLAGDPLGLLFLVVGLEPLDLDPALVLGPELLVLARDVARDDRMGGVEDQLGRPVVLLQLDDGRRRPVALEIEDVPEVGAAPGVDRLVVVADDAEVVVGRRQRPDPQVLGAVRVLVFVDVEIAPASAGTSRARPAPARRAGRPRGGGHRSRARWPCGGGPGSASRGGRSSARDGSLRSPTGTSGRASRSSPG